MRWWALVLCVVGAGPLEAREPALDQPESPDARPSATTLQPPERVFNHAAAAVDPVSYQDVSPLTPATPLRPFGPPANQASPLAPRPPANARQVTRRGRYTPAMIGDLEGGGSGGFGTFGTDVTVIEHPTFPINRLNISENNSPVPQDRVFLRYNHLHNSTDVLISNLPPRAPMVSASQIDVDRYTVGLEKTFADGAWSLEARVPFARQLTNDVELSSINGVSSLPLDDRTTQFGNIGFVGKALLYESDACLVSGGLGILLPTAPDVRFSLLVVEPDPFRYEFSGRLENRVVELTPFVSALVRPDDDWFFQGFLQISAPLNKAGLVFNQQYTDPNVTLVDPAFERSFRTQTIARLSVGGGRWLFRDPSREWFTGLAWSLEAHYTSTLQDAEIVRGFLFASTTQEVGAGNFSNRVDLLNLTTGPTLEIHRRTTLAVGLVAPVRDQSDRAFDFEANLQLNHRF